MTWREDGLRPTTVTIAATVMAAAAMLLGCAGSGGDGEPRGVAGGSGPTPTVATGPASSAAATSTSAGPTTSAAPPAPGRCTSTALAVAGRAAGASAGHRHDMVIFTNTGSVPCTLHGYPGVSYLDASGAPAGLPAQRLEDDAPVVVLAPGEQAHASLNQSQGYMGGAGCGPTAEGVTLQVYPPAETVALTVPYRSDLCTTAVMLSVGVVYPGTEMVAGENAGA
jgi:hypothetical protein